MDPWRSVAGYAILAGALDLLIWVYYALTGTLLGEVLHVPGLAFHIAAEVATGLALLAGGGLVLRRIPRGPAVLLLSLGMLLYAVVNALGFYDAWWNRALLLGTLGVTLAAAAWLLVSGEPSP